MQTAKLGLTFADNDSKLTQKVLEQRNKIKQLQGLLIRAKQDFDSLKNAKPSNANGGNDGE